MNQTDIVKQVGRSGLPFQLKVEDEVRVGKEIHNWSVVSREHPWTNPETLESGFIDVVLRHDGFTTFRLVIECKRMKADDARQLRWLFLIPDGEFRPTNLASCLEVEGGARRFGSEAEWSDIRLWDNVRLKPESLESEFCVLPSDEQRRQPIIESLASDLLDSLEGLAQEEVDVERSQSGSLHLRLFMFPAIVTNAEIVACRFKSGDVRVSDGMLDPSSVELTTVPFIRFRKSLATQFPSGSFQNLSQAHKARERTVFVVNAASISEFLTGWEMSPTDHDGYAIQRHIG